MEQMLIGQREFDYILRYRNPSLTMDMVENYFRYVDSAMEKVHPYMTLISFDDDENRIPVEVIAVTDKLNGKLIIYDKSKDEYRQVFILDLMFPFGTKANRQRQIRGVEVDEMPTWMLEITDIEALKSLYSHLPFVNQTESFEEYLEEFKSQGGVLKEK